MRSTKVFTFLTPARWGRIAGPSSSCCIRRRSRRKATPGWSIRRCCSRSGRISHRIESSEDRSHDRSPTRPEPPTGKALEAVQLDKKVYYRALLTPLGREWISDREAPVDDLPVVEIFGIQRGALSFYPRTENGKHPSLASVPQASRGFFPQALVRAAKGTFARARNSIAIARYHKISLTAMIEH